MDASSFTPASKMADSAKLWCLRAAELLPKAVMLFLASRAADPPPFRSSILMSAVFSSLSDHHFSALWESRSGEARSRDARLFGTDGSRRIATVGVM